MKYLPTQVCRNIFEIDFISLYARGKRIILSDLDNTIATYYEKTPSVDCLEWNKTLRKMGFKIYLVSNNHSNRITEYTKNFIVDGYISDAHKPFKGKMERFLKKNNINKEEVIAIGDQLVTDISAFNKLQVETILVKTINQKKQKWYTKINRMREVNILKKIKKVDYQKYNQIKEFYE